MSKFRLEFKLKQHTPIIHFQSDQNGATLRATELKPKLDRFITEELININNELYQEYKEIIEDENIFPKDKGCNQYQLSVLALGKNVFSTPKAYVNKRKEEDKTAYQAPYFSDLKSIICEEEISVTIKSFHTKLLKLLYKCKDYIFIYENFGTRQSKGFGSFMRNDINSNEIKNILQEYKNPIFTLGGYSNYQDAFEKIDIFYKELKMGINKPYKKSLLFQYMCDRNNLGWEKKFLKNKFPQIIHGTHSPLVCSEPDDKEFKYIRIVLGLAEINEYRPLAGKKQIKIESLERDEKDSRKSKYQRFKSPLTFKIFNGSIYVLFNTSYEDILNKKFNFSLNGKKETLSTPTDFDIYDFLQFVETKVNNFKEIK